MAKGSRPTRNGTGYCPIWDVRFGLTRSANGALIAPPSDGAVIGALHVTDCVSSAVPDMAREPHLKEV